MEMDEVVQQIREIALRYEEINKIVLFGSRARETQRPTSDYDIAVFTNQYPFQKKLLFYNEIDEIDVLYKIDVVVIDDETDRLLRGNIEMEGVAIVDRRNKVTNFIKAFERLLEALEECGDTPTSLNRDGTIQRFEFSAELAWKACREYLMDQGYVDINGPKPVMKEAFAYGLVDDSEGWIYILNDCNLTSHMYQEKVAQEIFERIKNAHILLFRSLAERLREPGGH